MNNLESLDKKLDIANKALSLAFKVGIIIGGAVLLLYCWKISYFPRDVSIGDGLLFLMLAIAFGGIYLLFTASLTCLGLTLRPLWLVLQNIVSWSLFRFNKFSNKTISFEKVNFVTAKKEHFILALFGLLFIWGFGTYDYTVLGSLGLSVFSCALLWSFYIQNEEFVNSTELQEQANEEDLIKSRQLKQNQKIILLSLILVPLLIGGVSGKLLDGAMGLSNVRTEKVTVHIKKPYLEYVSTYGLTKLVSSIGKDYGKFEKINILFNGFGKNVVIKSNSATVTSNIVIPNEYIIIMPL